MSVNSKLKICSEIILEISHNLLSKFSLKWIKKIYSNPQVFAQCRSWLKANLPQAELIEVSSTSLAAQVASREKNSACIASSLAMEYYNLRVIASSIEDSPQNVTRFLVIGKKSTPRSGEDKTSIMFSVRDRIGALHDMLAPFKHHKINLTKIESRPSKMRAWEYYFFVDFEGHSEDKNVKKALSRLKRRCVYLRVLGSYPRAQ